MVRPSEALAVLRVLLVLTAGPRASAERFSRDDEVSGSLELDEDSSHVRAGCDGQENLADGRYCDDKYTSQEELRQELFKDLTVCDVTKDLTFKATSKEAAEVDVTFSPTEMKFTVTVDSNSKVTTFGMPGYGGEEQKSTFSLYTKNWAVTLTKKKLAVEGQEFTLSNDISKDQGDLITSCCRLAVPGIQKIRATPQQAQEVTNLQDWLGGTAQMSLGELKDFGAAAWANPALWVVPKTYKKMYLFSQDAADFGKIALKWQEGCTGPCKPMLLTIQGEQGAFAIFTTFKKGAATMKSMTTQAFVFQNGKLTYLPLWGGLEFAEITNSEGPYLQGKGGGMVATKAGANAGGVEMTLFMPTSNQWKETSISFKGDKPRDGLDQIIKFTNDESTTISLFGLEQ